MERKDDTDQGLTTEYTEHTEDGKGEPASRFLLSKEEWASRSALCIHGKSVDSKIHRLTSFLFFR